MKNFLTPLFVILFLASCGMESMNDMQPDQEISSEDLLSEGIGTDMLNTQMRLASAGSCEDDCIEPGSIIYYPLSDMTSLSAGRNTKSVSYSAYNTETDFVVEVTYAVTAGPPNAKATITIDIDGDEVEYTEVSSGTTVSHTVPLADGWAGCEPVAFSVVQEGLGTPITFMEIYSLIPVCSELEFEDVMNPITGKIWMDRNLGATQVATSSTDEASYGDLYQWGRGTDGHQLRTSGTTGTLSSANQPDNGNFILVSIFPLDWRSPQNDNLWQGVNGINNPCPTGYRLPTETELLIERLSWVEAPISSTNTAAGAFASPLKLPAAGYRDDSNGSLGNVGTHGYYWSSTVSGTDSHGLFFVSFNAGRGTGNRATGASVRCLKD